jgi:hypothetical protein
MNWQSSILVAHIWVLAYTVEPILYLNRAATPQARALRQSCAAGRSPPV